MAKEPRRVRTTTVLVKKHKNFAELNAKYQLVRYEVPKSYIHRTDDNKYPKLHIQVKSQLNYPYYFFSPEPAIYVLYPAQAEIVPIVIDFLSDKALPVAPAQFTELKLHMLLKLLFADYFRIPHQPAFVAQGKYYLYVKSVLTRTGKYLFDICLQIEVQGDRRNNDQVADEWQVFQISSAATPFRLVDKTSIKEWSKNTVSYFKKMQPKDGLVFFNELRKDEIDDFDGEIYQIKAYEKHPARLDYHFHPNPEHGRGKILFDFINTFIFYLNKGGIEATQQYRSVSEFQPGSGFGELALKHLPLVQILDQRINTDNPTEGYVEVLQVQYPDVQFQSVSQIQPHSSTPTLILLDGTKEDFAQGGILAEFGEDPYLQIYGDKRFINTPKQSVVVNIPDREWSDSFEYLQYPSLSFSDKDDLSFRYRFDVALSELLQKDLVINARNTQGILPGFNASHAAENAFSKYLFVRKLTYTGIGNHWVLLYIDGDQLQFVDLRPSSNKHELYDRAEQLGMDWGEVYDALCQKRFKKPDDKKLLTEFDVILSQNLAVEIEDIAESVLYEYDQIIARRTNLQQPMSIDELRLGHRYDDARTEAMLSLAELQQLGLLTGKTPKSGKEKNSLSFYRKLSEFDDFLDDIEMERTQISFDELTNEANLQTIGKILDLNKNSETGLYSRRGLWNIYKRCRMFPGDKEKDVHLYQGIWYDDERRFMVGSPEGLKDRQVHAHRIRQFDVLSGEGQFDMELLLQTLAVTFVRNKQYTVVPYFFHLIDIYVENVLRWQEE